ncbi:DNA primase family protein [Leucobacter salsicius]|uniref:DNA primase family protein n=1 Tax=Leucobacter salsicius TaxID=664638 RepID=UPI00036BD198|nr:DNA primase family protein [Leucobacter salsicius]
MAMTTDADIGRDLALAWANSFLCIEDGWVSHDKGLWKPVPREVMLAHVSDWIQENVQSFDPREVHQLRSTKKAQAVLLQLAGRLQASLSSFDADPFLFKTTDAVVDLRTGQERPPKPTDRFMRQAGVRYFPGASRERLCKMLEAVPADAREWLQIQLGVALFGKQSPTPRVVIFKGAGRNGKTTLMNAVYAALGTYAGRLDPEAISGGGRTNPEYHLAMLKGIRYLVAEELEDKMLNEAVIKRITDSGSAKGRNPGGRPFDFVLTHDLYISTNASLRIRSHNLGTTRRFVEVPFPYTFAADPVSTNERALDTAVKEWFDTPREEILAWLIEGAARAHAQPELLDSAHLPPSVRTATEDWSSSQNIAAEFVSLRLETDESGYITNTELLSEYNSFRSRHGHGPVSTPTMLDELRNTVLSGMIPATVREQPTRGTRDRRDRAILGLRLKSESDNTEEASRGLF